ncbi:hypothetical protein L1049_001127 [Liquidambar formosana]|uniref:FBD domain-containing protein n=1 Tax=Liquidambar formosana TaxID=63359 RepID=A0AAP0R864_LIQFO
MSGEQGKTPRALKLLGGIRNVGSLTISDDTFGPLRVEGLLDQLPTFSKLTHLEVDTKVYYNFRAVIVFLQRLPTLECLVFSEGIGPCMPSDEVDWTLEPVPQCFKSCLKRFSIKNFHGGEPELLFLKFILKNALVLERMKVFILHYLSEDLKKREEFSDQLQMLPRGSASCDVVLL